MVIKPSKLYNQKQILVAVLMLIAPSRFLVDGDRLGIIFWLICLVMFSGMYIPDWIATGRTFIMSETGCTVCFLWYRKEYKWDDFKVKGVEDFRYAREYKSTYKKGVVFSPRRIRKPWWWTPSMYCSRLHPFSFVFVNFTPEERWPGMPGIHEVDEEEFMAKMKEWNVELEELNFYFEK